jgi:hypothetical protein
VGERAVDGLRSIVHVRDSALNGTSTNSGFLGNVLKLMMFVAHHAAGA